MSTNPSSILVNGVSFGSLYRGTDGPDGDGDGLPGPMPNGGSCVSRWASAVGFVVPTAAMRPWVKSTATGGDGIEGATTGLAVATESRRAAVVALAAWVALW